MSWIKSKQKASAKQDLAEKQSLSSLLSHHHTKPGPVLVIHGGGFSDNLLFLVVCQRTRPSQELVCFCGKSKQIHGPTIEVHVRPGLKQQPSSSPAQIELYRTALRNALVAGNEVLQAGGQAMDAAVAAVTSMESEPAI